MVQWKTLFLNNCIFARNATLIFYFDLLYSTSAGFGMQRTAEWSLIFCKLLRGMSPSTVTVQKWKCAVLYAFSSFRKEGLNGSELQEESSSIRMDYSRCRNDWKLLELSMKRQSLLTGKDACTALIKNPLAVWQMHSQRSLWLLIRSNSWQASTGGEFANLLFGLYVIGQTKRWKFKH